jgi:hypothetical protein
VDLYLRAALPTKARKLRSGQPNPLAFFFAFMFPGLAADAQHSAQRYGRAHGPSHDQEAALVGPAPGGIDGGGGKQGLGQEQAQQGMLEPVGPFARRHAEGVVGGQEAGPGVAGIAEELGQRW